MTKQVLVAIGAVLLLMGALWTGQGVGWIGGSPMTGVTLWAVIGPVVALAGLAMIVLGLRRPGQSQ